MSMKFLAGFAIAAAAMIAGCHSAPTKSTAHPEKYSWNAWTSRPGRGPASIIGLYYYNPGDKISVFAKDDKPYVRIDFRLFPDHKDCKGLQLTREDAPLAGALDLVEGSDGKKGTGFTLWESKACLNYLQTTTGKIKYKAFSQTIDVNAEYFAKFTNGAAMAESFKKGDIVFGIGFQGNAGYDSMQNEVVFNMNDARDGKTLLYREFIPPKILDLKLTKAMKPAKGDVSLWESGYGPGRIDEIVKERATLTGTFEAREIARVNAEDRWYDYYRIYYHDKKEITRAEVLKLAEQGKTICFLRVHLPKGWKGDKITLKKLNDKIGTGSAGVFFSDDEEAAHPAIEKNKYYAQHFDLNATNYGKGDVKAPQIGGGGCAAARGNYEDGHQFVLQDIYDNVPGVQLFSNYPGYQM